MLEEERVDKSHLSAQREVGEGHAALKYIKQETPKCFVPARRCAVLGNSLQAHEKLIVISRPDTV